jgi:hypothetical protein
MAEEKKDDGDEEDGRIEFLCSFTIKSLRLKAEKWQKMMSNADFKVHMSISSAAFLNNFLNYKIPGPCYGMD